jgi:3'(2'), 5'-bisphosphate nucleotidase
VTYTTEKECAVSAVIRAAELCSRVQDALAHKDYIQKVDRSPVTIADYGAQAVVNRILMSALPDDPVVGEEDASQLRDPVHSALLAKILEQVAQSDTDIDNSSLLDAIDHGNADPGGCDRFWTLDPIDGTKGFLRGDQYAIALGLIENGRVVLGVLGCPNLPVNVSDPHSGKGCLFIAVRGQGTIMQPIGSDTGIPVRVDSIADPSLAVFCESVESGHTSHGRSAQVAEILGVTAEPYRIDSQCKYAAVARGDASIYMRLPSKKEYREKIWDHAAGSLIVEEAGGMVTDTLGSQLEFSLGTTLAGNTGVFASNGVLHGRVLSALNTTA